MEVFTPDEVEGIEAAAKQLTVEDAVDKWLTVEDAVDKWLADHGIAYEATFCPDEDEHARRRLHDCILHWRITLGKSIVAFHTGVGFLPGEIRQRGFDVVRTLCATGLIDDDEVFATGSTIAECARPRAASVLLAMFADLSAEDLDFEEWAAEYGYNPDSRQAEQTFWQCQANARKLRRAVKPHSLDELQELLADY